jgi:transposase
MGEQYPVSLSGDQKLILRKITTSGKNSARTFKRAMILLACSENKTYTEIMSTFGVSRTMVRNTRKNLYIGGLEAALHEKPRPGQPLKVTPDVEAKLIALACEAPPEGRESWTIDLLKEGMSTRFSVNIGWGTVQRKLDKTELKPWKKRCGVSRR